MQIRISQSNSAIPSLMLMLVITALTCLTHRVVAADFFVPNDSSSIQTFLNAASSGDTIHVAPGTYVGNLNFNNKLVTLVSDAGPQVTTIKVSGGIGVTISGAAVLKGFTITGANSDFGAGVMVGGIGTVIKNNIFDGNHQSAGGFGAGIGGNNASPIIDSNIFRNNSSDSQFTSGVVSFVNGSSPLIINNIFENNQSRAINFTLPTGTHPQVINNTIVNNSVGVRGLRFALSVNTGW